MSANINDWVDSMRSGLAVSDPDLDTSVGSTTRKIIDVVAESISESYMDQHMLTYQYDIDSKIEGDLDTFCQAIGGISRLAAKRANGTVTFTRTGTGATTVLIPVNTQINTTSSPVVAVQTITGASMGVGQLSVSVPVQAVVAGPQGNVGANSLTAIASQVEGVAAVTNLQPLTGGTLQETDDELRDRWKKTAFRSNAGTDPMYLATALNDPDVTAAQVIGASKRRREQVQVTGGSASSTVDDAAYVFTTGVFLGGNLDNNTLLLKDLDYAWASTTPPKITMASGVSTYDTGNKDSNGNPVRAAIEGAVLDLDFEYTPQASRNDPEGTRFGKGSILNRVDVWVAGQRPVQAQQSVVFRSDKVFTGDTTSTYATSKFARLDNSTPAVGNVFLPLAFGPIISVPDVLSVGGVTYGRVGASTTGITKPNAYQVVHETGCFGYAATSRFGLEWLATALPPTNTVFTFGNNGGYVYNEIPRSVQADIDRWRLVGVDAQVHAARQIGLRFNLAIMYERTANQSAVNEAIDVAISTYLGRVGLGGVVQVSDIEQTVHNVPGVDNVRMSSVQDSTGWTYATTNQYPVGIQRVVNGSVVQTYVTSAGLLRDVVFGDSEAPVFDSSTKKIKAQNTFGYLT